MSPLSMTLRRTVRHVLQRVSPGVLARWKGVRHANARRRDLAALAERRRRLLAGLPLSPAGTRFAIHHELTLRCNLHCDFCYQGDLRADHEPDEATLAELERLYANVRPARAVFVGSEVFLHREFLAILERLDALGTELHVITNGTLIREEEARRLLALDHLASVILSIDGPPEVHDRLRGSRGTYERTVKAARLLAGRKELALHCVLQDGNLECAEEVLDLAAELGVPSVHYGFLYAYGADELEATHALLESRLGWSRDEVRLTALQREGLGFEVERLRAAVERIEEHGRRVGIVPVFAPQDFRDHLEAYVAGTLHETHRLVCRDRLNPEDLRLDPRGKVHPCAVIHKVLGDSATDDPRELADGDEARRFAALLEEENLLPICRRCCRVAVLEPHPRPSPP